MRWSIYKKIYNEKGKLINDWINLNVKILDGRSYHVSWNKSESRFADNESFRKIQKNINWPLIKAQLMEIINND